MRFIIVGAHRDGDAGGHRVRAAAHLPCHSQHPCAAGPAAALHDRAARRGASPIGLPLPRHGLRPFPKPLEARRHLRVQPFYYWPAVFYWPEPLLAAAPPEAPAPPIEQPPALGRLILDVQPTRRGNFCRWLLRRRSGGFQRPARRRDSRGRGPSPRHQRPRARGCNRRTAGGHGPIHHVSTCFESAAASGCSPTDDVLSDSGVLYG